MIKKNNFTNNEIKDSYNNDYVEIIEDIDLDIDEDDFDEDYDLILNEEFAIEFDEDVDNKDDYTEHDSNEEDKFDLLYHFNTNKHKQDGKHRLKEDTIFKGKTDKKSEDDIYDYQEDNDYNDVVNFFNDESEEYSKNDEQNKLSKDVYDILVTKTDIDLTQNRRKPNKDLFNSYYNLLIKELGFKYTKSELFVELSFYFTDNVFNMYKLLDKESATVIIKELMNKGYLKHLNNINFL